MATTTESYEDAISVARTNSKVQPLTVCVYQTGARSFAAAYEGEAIARGVLCAQFKNGFSVADPRSEARRAGAPA